MRKSLSLVFTVFSILMCGATAQAEEADEPVWNSAPQGYAAISNILSVREQFHRAMVANQSFIEILGDSHLRFWFLVYGPNYRIYSEAGEAVKERSDVYRYSGNGDSTCDLRFLLKPLHTLRIEGAPKADGTQSGARFCPAAGLIVLQFQP